MMRIERRFTEAGKSPYDAIQFRESGSEIRNPDGSVVFALDQFTVPAHWSQVAADILAQKYFRKAGVPAKSKKVEEPTVPSWLWRSVPDHAALAALPEKERFGGEERCHGRRALRPRHWADAETRRTNARSLAWTHDI
jgi:ribonucleoside-diphosphate reductase alpha chain